MTWPDPTNFPQKPYINARSSEESITLISKGMKLNPARRHSHIIPRIGGPIATVKLITMHFLAVFAETLIHTSEHKFTAEVASFGWRTYIAAAGSLLVR